MASKTPAAKPAAYKLMPTKYRANAAVLSYVDSPSKEVRDPKSWVTLEAPSGYYDGNNVGIVEFDGMIHITQKSNDVKCILDFTTANYNDVRVIEGKEPSDPITIMFSVVGEANVRYEPDVAGAHNLPLALAYLSFHHIRLVLYTADLKSTGGYKTHNHREQIGHLKVLLTGRERLDPNSPWNRVFAEDYRVLGFEQKAQEAQLGRFKRCRIVTSLHQSGKALVGHVYFVKPGSVKDQETDEEDVEDVLASKIGQSFFVSSSKLLPVDEATLKDHGILSTSETKGWELSVSKTPDDSDADLVGTFANTFPKGDILSFVGEDHGVTLDPIFRDVLRQSQLFYNESKKLRGFFVNANKEVLPKSKLPVDMLFIGPECQADKNDLPADLGALADIIDLLDETQADAFANALSHAISIAQGPAGTGKGRLVGAIIRALVVKGEKIAATTSSNVAVNNLLKAAVSFWKLIVPDIPPPFARIFSETQILSQWAMRELGVLNSPYHLDQLRYKRACQEPQLWTGYVEGRTELAASGIIDSKELYEAYSKDAKKLSVQVLQDGIMAVFCTVTGAAQSSALYQEDPVDGELKWFYPATAVIVDDAGTIWRPALMMLAMTFRDATRLILAGDPLQLTGLLLDRRSRSVWKKVYLQDIMDRKFPTVILKRQYRMHDWLYAATAAVIYKMAIASKKLTSEPSAFLRHLLTSLIIVNGSQASYELPSYCHFLDVAHGVEETGEGSSSFNQAEIEVVSSLVLSLLDQGFSKDEICVLTGYAAQQKALKAAAKANGWVGLKILTVDASQGTEHLIMILSLVKTKGSPGFIGKRQRTNVATSRQKEALYFVGKASFWFARVAVSKKWMHEILKSMKQKIGGFIAAAQPTPMQQIPHPFQPWTSTDEPATSAALAALSQRYEAEVNRLYDEDLKVQEPLDFQIRDLSIKRSAAKSKADQDRLDGEIVKLDEVLRKRQEGYDRAMRALDANYEREERELAAAEEEDNDEDLYTAD